MGQLPAREQLHSEQIEALASNKNQDQIILGVAGGGKTVIAIYRAVDLLADIDSLFFDKQKVLILTFNNAIHSFIKNNINQIANGEDNIDVNTVYTYFRDIVNSCSPKEELKLLNKHEYDYLVSANRYYADNQCAANHDVSRKATAIAETINNKIINGLVNEAYLDNPDNNIWKKDNLSLDDVKKAIKDEIKWMQDNEIAYNDEESYLQVSRVGRSSFNLGKKGGNQRKLVYDIYHKYYQKRDAYRNSNGESRIFSYSDVYRLVKYIQIPESQKYDYIIVDEVQDLSPAMFDALSYLRKTNGHTYFTLLGDLSQNIYGRRMSWKSLGLQINRGNSHRIKHNYRNTYQISKVGKDLLDYCKLYYSFDVESDSYRETDSAFIEPDLSSNQNGHPVFAVNDDDEMVIRMVKMALKNDENILITYRSKDDRKKIIELLDGKFISYSSSYDEDNGNNKVFVLSMKRIKGLQFPNVIVYCFDSMDADINREEIVDSDGTVNYDLMNDEEANIFYAQQYVSITRAEKILMLVYKNPKTANLLQDICSDGSIRFI